MTDLAAGVERYRRVALTSRANRRRSDQLPRFRTRPTHRSASLAPAVTSRVRRHRPNHDSTTNTELENARRLGRFALGTSADSTPTCSKKLLELGPIQAIAPAQASPTSKTVLPDRLPSLPNGCSISSLELLACRVRDLKIPEGRPFKQVQEKRALARDKTG